MSEAYFMARTSEPAGNGRAECVFLLVDKPEVYNLPPDPVVPTHHGRDGDLSRLRRWGCLRRPWDPFCFSVQGFEMSTNTHERVRYADSVDPVRADGRDIDAALGVLEGEGAQQKVTEATSAARRDSHGLGG